MVGRLSYLLLVAIASVSRGLLATRRSAEAWPTSTRASFLPGEHWPMSVAALALLAVAFLAAVGAQCARRSRRPAAGRADQHARSKSTIGISFDSRPPCGFRWLRRMCLYTRFTPSTTSFACACAITRSTLPRVPRSSPAITSTVIVRRDLHHTTSLARLTIFMKFRSRSSRATAPKMRVPRGFLFVVDDHHRVAVEADVAAVGAAGRLLAAHDHALDHRPSSSLRCRRSRS